jgi:hypothetical protein
VFARRGAGIQSSYDLAAMPIGIARWCDAIVFHCILAARLPSGGLGCPRAAVRSRGLAPSVWCAT